jgi:hypothetical protein
VFTPIATAPAQKRCDQTERPILHAFSRPDGWRVSIPVGRPILRRAEPEQQPHADKLDRDAGHEHHQPRPSLVDERRDVPAADDVEIGCIEYVR